MKQLKSKALLLLATLASVIFLAAAPVAAHDGNSGSGSSDGADSASSSSSSDQSDNENESETEDSTQAETETEMHHQAVQHMLSKFHTEAHNDLAKLREGKHQLSVKGRQKACEVRQAAINRKVTRFGTRAQRHLDVFSSIFTKVQNFQTNKKLDAPNYDSLVAAANAKKDAASSAVAALKSLSINIDCSASDPAATLETLKTSVKSTREALQAYRKAIIDVISALSVAKDDSSTSAETN